MIKIKNAENTYKNKEWLIQKYIIEGLSSYKIAAICGLKRKDSIIGSLKKFDIKLRKRGAKANIKFSEEHKEAISKAEFGRKAWNKGKKLSENHKNAISKSMEKK